MPSPDPSVWTQWLSTRIDAPAHMQQAVGTRTLLRILSFEIGLGHCPQGEISVGDVLIKSGEENVRLTFPPRGKRPVGKCPGFVQNIHRFTYQKLKKN